MINKLKIIGILFSTVINLGFNKPNIKLHQQEKVFFTANKNDTIMKLINLDEFHNEFTDKSFLTKSKKETGNLDIEFNLSTSQLFRFSCLNPQTAPIIIFVSPNDSLTYRMHNNSILSKVKMRHIITSLINLMTRRFIIQNIL